MQLTDVRASKSNLHCYNKELRSFANDLRHNSTKAEACIWKYVLRVRQMRGFQFRRQRPVLDFIADFMCKELMLIVEVDGITHTYPEVIEQDRIKQRELERVGFTVLRFSDDEVLTDINGVYEVISEWINQSGIPPPNPRQRGTRTRKRPYSKYKQAILPRSSDPE